MRRRILWQSIRIPGENCVLTPQPAGTPGRIINDPVTGGGVFTDHLQRLARVHGKDQIIVRTRAGTTIRRRSDADLRYG